MALMSVNNRNVARSIGSPAATPHPKEAKCPCWESHVSKFYAGLPRWPTSGIQGNVQVPSPSQRGLWGNALLLYQKGNGRKEGNCFSCAGHRPGPGNLAGVSVILKMNTSGQLLLAPAVRVIQPRRALSRQRKGWVGQQRSRGPPPHPRLTELPPPELNRNLQGHKCLWHNLS